MIPIALSTPGESGREYVEAIAAAGGRATTMPFDLDTLDAALAQTAGVVVSGGGDVDPALYGGVRVLAHDIDGLRDTFEIELLLRARERRLPTLCICRGLQIANVAFGGSLIEDLGTSFDPPTAALHRKLVDGKSERGLIAGHDVAVVPDSRLAAIVKAPSLVTGSRHHQSLARIAPELRVVATTPDGVVEAAEAQFDSPFWLGVQWHPESTLALDDGASRAIFAAFIAAAERFGRP